MRTTPTPALPGAVATAMMGNFLVIIAVPFSLNAKPSKITWLLFCKHLVNLPLLCNGQQVINYPVQHQSSREEKEHY